jgi:hypothetical protein
MHPRHLTPTYSTLAMGVVSAICYVALTLVSTNVLQDSAAAVGLLIAFYYGLTGFACTWFFRGRLRDSARNLWFQGVLPLLGGLVLLGAFVLSVRSYLPASSSASSLLGMGGIFVIGVGALLLGAVLMLLMRWRAQSFFRAAAGQAATETTMQPLLVRADGSHD